MSHNFLFVLKRKENSLYTLGSKITSKELFTTRNIRNLNILIHLKITLNYEVRLLENNEKRNQMSLDCVA